MNPNQGGIKTWQWVVTAIVIIVLIIVGIMVFGNKSSQTPADQTGATGTSTNTPGGAVNRIVMSDQYPGNVVYLSSVQLAQPGWVVIQSDNNGQPGAIIGSAHFDTGINPGQVTLSSPTVEGGTYYAVIYTDDGSGAFNPNVDKPLTDANGNIIMQIFHASASVGAGLKG